MTRRNLLRSISVTAAGTGAAILMPKTIAQADTLPLDTGLLDNVSNVVSAAIQRGTRTPGDFAAMATAYNLLSAHLENTGYNAKFEQITRNSSAPFNRLNLPDSSLGWIRKAWYDRHVAIPVDPASLVGYDYTPTVDYVRNYGLQALSTKAGNLLMQAAADSCGDNCVVLPYFGEEPQQGLKQLGAALSLLSAVWAAGGWVAAFGGELMGATVVCPLCTGVAVTFAVIGGGIMYFAEYSHMGHDIPVICGGDSTAPPFCH